MSASVLLAGLAAGIITAAVASTRTSSVRRALLAPAPATLPPRTLRRLGPFRRVQGAYRRRKASRQAVEQLPDGVATVADALRAGLSLPDAFAFAAKEIASPLDEQFGRIVDSVEDGLPTETALSRWASERADDRSVGLFVAVLSLHRRTGGDIPTILDGVGRTIRDRARAVAEVASLTAQARLSAAVIVLLPIGFLAFVAITSPRDLATSVGSPIGLVSLIVGLVLDALAFLWMRSLLRVVV